MKKIKIVVTCAEIFTKEFRQLLKKNFQLVEAECSLSEEASIKALAEANLLIMGGNEIVTPHVLESIPPTLKFIFAGIEARTAFPGTWEQVQDRVYVTGGGQKAVVKTTIDQLTFYAALRLQSLMAKNKQLPIRRDQILRDKTLLVIGAGTIGKGVMLAANSRFKEVIYAGGRGEKSDLHEQGFRYIKDLKKAMSLADLVTIHLELNPATEKYLNNSHLLLLPRQALVVNNARAGIIGARDLSQFLRTRPDVQMICDEFYLNGEALLVKLNDSVPNLYKRLINYRNFWYTGHTASLSEATMREYSDGALRILTSLKPDA